MALDSLAEVFAPEPVPGWESSSWSRAAASRAAICELSEDDEDRFTVLLLVVVVDEGGMAEEGVVLVVLPEEAVVVVVGPLEAVLVIGAADVVAGGALLLLLLDRAPRAGGVEIGIGDEIGGGGVGSGAEAIKADTFGVFGVLTGGGGIGPFGVKLGDGDGMGTLFPEEFRRSPPLVGVAGI